MIRREEGFTLVELMITMAILVLALAASSTIFTGLLTQFKQQGKIAETSIEGVVGLEIMRHDIENAGVGLPQDLNGATYFSGPETVSATDALMNDTPPAAPAAVRSVVGQMMNLSDMFAVKSVPVANNKATQRWTEISCNGVKKANLWGDASGDLYRVITLASNRLSSSTTGRKLIIQSANAWSTTYGSIIDGTSPYSPPLNGGVCDQTSDTYIIYGVAESANLRMPFNRADYYVKVPANLPTRCATGTGVLYKGIVNHADGTLLELPLLDCVATMRVLFALDVKNDGNITYTDNISAMSAADIGSQLKEVRVYILAQEGQKDPSYTYPNNTVTLGEFALGLPFNMAGITNYSNYRWKQYTLIVRPNLGQ